MQHNATQHSTVPCYCERPCVLKGLWAIYLERETKSFSPFLLLWSYKWQLFEKQSWRGPNLFRSSRRKAWALTLGLWGRRKELHSWFSHSYSRIRWSTAKKKKDRLWREQVIQSFFFLFLFNGCWTKNEWMWRIIVCMNESAYQYHSFIFIFQLFFWRTIHFTFLKNVQTSLHSLCKTVFSIQLHFPLRKAQLFEMSPESFH